MDGWEAVHPFFFKLQDPSVQAPQKSQTPNSNSSGLFWILDLESSLELGRLGFGAFRAQLKPAPGVCSFATSYESDWNDIFAGDEFGGASG
jgi:hypothetical protein